MAAPTTAILEDFAGASAAPPNASWTRLGGFTADLKRDGSGKGANNAAAGAADYINGATYGPDSEAYVTVSTLINTAGRTIRLGLRCTNPTSSTLRCGYELEWAWNSGAGNDVWTLYRVDNNARTSLATFTGEDLAAGDKFWFNIIGSALIGYHYNGTSWVQVLNATDTTYNTAGNIYLGTNAASTDSLKMDDFGGGTLVHVTKTLTASYNVQQQISKTLSSSYTIKIPIVKELTTSYTVRKPITKTLVPSYNVIQRIPKTLTASYNVHALPKFLVNPVITGTPLSGQLLTENGGTLQADPVDTVTRTQVWQVETGPATGVYADVTAETATTLQL